MSVTILITGADGFIGRELAATLARRGALPDGRSVNRLVLTDRSVEDAPEGLETMAGDLTDPGFQASIARTGPDLVFHLAGVLGGTSERQPALSWNVNFNAPVCLFAALAQAKRPVVINSSSIGVYGTPMPDRIDDHTPIEPTLAYGTHKRMLELHLAERTRAGALEGRTVRLPAVVAKPPMPGLRPPAAFWGDLFHHAVAGRALSIPVHAEATVGMMSVGIAVDNLLSATVNGSSWPVSRACTIPALPVTAAALIEALSDRLGPHIRTLFSYAPETWTQAQYGSFPVITSEAAEKLGFVTDTSIGALVDAVLTRIAADSFTQQ